MPDLELLYPGRFLKGPQIPESPPTRIEILEVGTELFESDEPAKAGKKKKDTKGIITAKMRDPVTGVVGPKEIVWCKTNALLTAQIYGRNTDEWIGKTVFIHFRPDVKFGSETPGGIRVCGAPASVLPRSVPVTIKRPHRKPEVYTLRPIGPAAPRAEAPAAEPATPPDTAE